MDDFSSLTAFLPAVYALTAAGAVANALAVHPFLLATPRAKRHPYPSYRIIGLMIGGRGLSWLYSR